MTVVLGAGLSGLSAAAWLTRAGHPVTVLEKGPQVGGLARTISHGDFHFDLGGHRFLTENDQLLSFVSDLLGDDLLTVPRRSQIYIGGQYIDYPLTPLNAVFGLGPAKTGAILLDYGKEKIRSAFKRRTITSLEDWVVSQFGRTMFELYFKDYSEKVWGIASREISKDWVAKRIDGLSLGQFIQHALLRLHRHRVKTLTDSFLYPRLGIGQLADRMHALIGRKNPLTTDSEVDTVFHDRGNITSIQYSHAGAKHSVRGDSYISSIPITRFIEKMRPLPPEKVRAAAAGIRFRSLVIVALFLKKNRLTDLTWMYFPEETVPFGRIHEPKNWSSDLAPPGQSHVIAEYFCNTGDSTWTTSDADLAGATAGHLERLGFVDPGDVFDSLVLRIPYAYPVFDVEYCRHLRVLTDFLAGFANLHLIGRNGMFSYLNMDQAMESGILVAEKVMQGCRAERPVVKNEVPASCPQYLQPGYSS